MTEYNGTAVFGTVKFKIGDMTPRRKPATAKTKMGKTYAETPIAGKNALDRVIEINGLITGLSQTSEQTRAQAIEIDRAALISLDDGMYRSYNDGKHSGNFVIARESLTWPDEGSRASGEPYKFTMTLIEWQ